MPRAVCSSYLVVRLDELSLFWWLMRTDKLLLCVPGKGYKKGDKGSLNFKREVPLKVLMVMDAESKVNDHARALLLENMEDRKKVWVIYFETPEEKKEWFKALRGACGKAKLGVRCLLFPLVLSSILRRRRPPPPLQRRLPH